MAKTVEVRLSVVVSGQQATATLRFINKTQQDIYLDKINACLDGTIENDVFEISTGDKSIEYIGILAKRKVKPQDFYRLKPGEEIESKVSIDKVYQFPAGTHEYKIRYYAYHSYPGAEKDLHLVSDYERFVLTTKNATTPSSGAVF